MLPESEITVLITPLIFNKTPENWFTFKTCLNREVNSAAITRIEPCPKENKNNKIAAFKILALTDA